MTCLPAVCQYGVQSIASLGIQIVRQFPRFHTVGVVIKIFKNRASRSPKEKDPALYLLRYISITKGSTVPYATLY